MVDGMRRMTAAAVHPLAGQPIGGIPIGGIKVVTDAGWFAARPSGTEAIYKLYAESVRDPAHLARIQQEASAIIHAALVGER